MPKPKAAVTDASHLYEVAERIRHIQRPGFRLQEITLTSEQSVPWHFHNHVSDTFYVLEGEVVLYLQDPKQSVSLGQGESFSVEARRPHLVTNGGDNEATFLLLQGVGAYDYVPLV